MPIPLTTRFLGLWVRIPPRAWMLVSCGLFCCQVEVSATTLSLVERSRTECSAQWCDLETSRWRRKRRGRPWSALGRAAAGRWWWMGGEKHREVYTVIPTIMSTNMTVARSVQRTQDTACRSSGAELPVFHRESPDFVPCQSMCVDDTEPRCKLLHTSVSRHQ